MAHAIDKLDSLAQAVKVQQAQGDWRWLEIRQGSIVGPIYGNGGVETIGLTNDQVWIGTPTDADNLNPLAAQWMAGMSDSHPSQGRLG